MNLPIRHKIAAEDIPIAAVCVITFGMKNERETIIAASIRHIIRPLFFIKIFRSSDTNLFGWMTGAIVNAIIILTAISMKISQG